MLPREQILSFPNRPFSEVDINNLDSYLPARPNAKGIVTIRCAFSGGSSAFSGGSSHGPTKLAFQCIF